MQKIFYNVTIFLSILPFLPVTALAMVQEQQIEDIRVNELVRAAQEGKLTRIRKLLENPHDSGTGETPRTASDTANQVEVVSLDPRLINMRDSGTGETPFTAAAAANKVEAVSFFLKNGAQIDMTNAQGRTAMDLACKEQHARIVALLLEAGAQAPQDLRTVAARNAKRMKVEGRAETKHPFIKDVAEQAVKHGLMKAVKKLIDVGLDINSVDHIPVIVNLVNCRIEMYKTLVELGWKPRLHRATCELMGSVAACNANVPLVKFLVGQHKQLNLDHLLFVALHDRSVNLQIIKLLLAKGAKPKYADAYGLTPLLIQALKNNRTDVMEVLIGAGADVNCTDQQGTTLLELALQSRYAHIARLLIKHGAQWNWHVVRDQASEDADEDSDEDAMDIDNEEGTDFMPLIRSNEKLINAILKGDVYRVTELIRSNEDLVKANLSNYNALQLAAFMGYLPIVELLVNSKASKYNVLDWAAAGGNLQIIEYLIKEGAASPEYIEKGYNPLVTAIRLGHTHIIDTLIKAQPLLLNIAGRRALKDADISSTITFNAFMPEIVPMFLQGRAFIQPEEIASRFNCVMAWVHEEAPLCSAMLTENSEVVTKLISEGAKVPAVYPGIVADLYRLPVSLVNKLYFAKMWFAALTSEELHRLPSTPRNFCKKGFSISHYNTAENIYFARSAIQNKLALVRYIDEYMCLKRLPVETSEYQMQLEKICALPESVKGQTPLMFACMFGHREVAEAYIKNDNLKHKASAQDSSGRTALMYAIIRENQGLANLLLVSDLAGAFVNLRDEANNTALMYALIKGDMYVVGLAITAGAEITPKFLQIAIARGCDRMLGLFHLKHDKGIWLPLVELKEKP